MLSALADVRYIYSLMVRTGQVCLNMHIFFSTIRMGWPSLLIVILSAGILQAQSAEIRFLKKVNAREIRPLTTLFKISSKSVTPLSVGISAGIIAAGLFKNEPELTYHGIQVASSVLLASLGSTALKYSIKRRRPFQIDPELIPRVRAHDPSFPSGHTTVAFALATAVSILHPKWYVVGPSCLWAGSVAFSRMYLGVHFPTDILGGMVIGTGVSILVWQGRRWISRN